MHWSLNHDACMRPTNPTRDPHKREIELCDRWPMPIMVEWSHVPQLLQQPTAEIEMQFCPNVCQKCRMNGYVKRKRNECCMTEWMNQLCGPASWGVHSNEYTQKRCMNDAWVAALSAFSVRGFPAKSKARNKRKRKICTTIKVKLVLTIVCDSKIPWILLENKLSRLLQSTIEPIV